MRREGLFLVLLLLLVLPVRAERADRRIKVACVGNSVTFGYGLKDRDHDSYPVQLQKMLDDKYGGGQFDVQNFGHSGATLLYKGHRPYVKLPEFRQALDFRPDWVVIHLGLNDTDPRNWPDWKEEFIPDYRALIDSFLVVNPEARILVCKMTPIFDRHSRFQSGTRDWHAQIQQAISQVAWGADVQLIDLFTPLHCRPDLFPDVLHPNPEGARILARTVYSALTGDYGGLRLPVLYGDGMVLQRDWNLVVHGTADARRQVNVVLRKEGKVVQESTVYTMVDGTWKTILEPMAAGGPYTLTVTSSDLSKGGQGIHYPSHYPMSLPGRKAKDSQSITINDVWFGDVWLASGQSNMEMRTSECNTLDRDLADADRLGQRLHLYNMPARARTDAVEWDDSVLRYTNQLRHMDFQGWKPSSRETVAAFSAVAFHFGRVLCDSLADVPIGIICNAVGGSTTESWIDRTTLEWEFPNILRDWRGGDFGQPWARGRMTQNIRHALDAESPSYNPLQRHPYEPSYLYEAAIRPLEHFALKGVLWYQGESNAHNIEVHERLFGLLQQSWRKAFSSTSVPRQTLPFYVVQLSSLPRPSWPAFRDSQRRLAASLPWTWLTVTTDLGDEADVHYRTKRPVGERLAAQALAHTYGYQMESEGPAVISATQGPGESLLLRFTHADGLAATRGFEIAGYDGLFHPADIVVSGSTIRLTSPEVFYPVVARYGWSGFTDADLHNAQGFPASTFYVEIEE